MSEDELVEVEEKVNSEPQEADEHESDIVAQVKKQARKYVTEHPHDSPTSKERWARVLLNSICPKEILFLTRIEKATILSYCLHIREEDFFKKLELETQNPAVQKKEYTWVEEVETKPPESLHEHAMKFLFRMLKKKTFQRPAAPEPERWLRVLKNSCVAKFDFDYPEKWYPNLANDLVRWYNSGSPNPCDSEENIDDQENGMNDIERDQKELDEKFKDTFTLPQDFPKALLPPNSSHPFLFSSSLSQQQHQQEEDEMQMLGPPNWREELSYFSHIDVQTPHGHGWIPGVITVHHGDALFVCYEGYEKAEWLSRYSSRISPYNCHKEEYIKPKTIYNIEKSSYASLLDEDGLLSGGNVYASLQFPSRYIQEDGNSKYMSNPFFQDIQNTQEECDELKKLEEFK